ncbi:MAG TPA: hypothetical protein VFW98_12305 [Gemmatimonadaceae bacterium]|nr:hypothetical protein [Gemmatimonadaceae bacterium]
MRAPTSAAYNAASRHLSEQDSYLWLARYLEGNGSVSAEATR